MRLQRAPSGPCCRPSSLGRGLGREGGRERTREMSGSMTGEARSAWTMAMAVGSRHIFCARSWRPLTHTAIPLSSLFFIPPFLTGHDKGCRSRGRATQRTKDASPGMSSFRQLLYRTHGCWWSWRTCRLEGGKEGGRTGVRGRPGGVIGGWKERTRATCFTVALLDSPASGLCV